VAKQRILMTGATSGLGAGAALELARDHHVTVGGGTWHEVRAFRERARQADARLDVVRLDLLNESDLAYAASLGVDTLVLNAAVLEGGSIVDVPMDLVRRAFDINVFAQLDLARRIVPQMMRRKRGRIVWMSSEAGLYAPPFLGVYAATKHAIEAIASVMRTELRPFGISVATINPGLVRTSSEQTGAESYGYWSPLADLLVPMPPGMPPVALVQDPQPMIDAIVEAIPDQSSLYRTMVPEDAVAETRLAQELAWTTRSNGMP